MAASVSRAQALSLVDWFCSQPSDRTRLRDHSLARLPKSAPVALLSVFYDRHRDGRHLPNAARKLYDDVSSQKNAALDSANAGRKGRRKKNHPNDNGTTTPKETSSQTVGSRVRSVENAEDTCNEYNTSCFAAHLDELNEDTEERIAIESMQDTTEKSGSREIPKHESTYQNPKRGAIEAALESQSTLGYGRHSDDCVSSKTVPVNGRNTNKSMSLKKAHSRSFSEISFVSSVKSSRRKHQHKKVCSDLLEQDCGQVKSETGLAQAVRLEHDAKIGQNVIDITESLDSLPSVPSLHLVTEVNKVSVMAIDNLAIGDKENSDDIKDNGPHTATRDERTSGFSNEGRKNLFGGLKLWKRRRNVQKELFTENVDDLKEEGGECQRDSKDDKDMCRVRWVVEMQLDASQKLFLVGDSPHVGSWQPAKAISFSMYEQNGKSTVWQGQCQVPFGLSSEYNYFVEVTDRESSHIIWRPGPRLLFTTPLKGSQDREVIIKDALDFDIVNKLPSLSWEKLQNKIGIPTTLKRFFGDKVLSEESSEIIASERDSVIIPPNEKSPRGANLRDPVIDASSKDMPHPQHAIKSNSVEVDGVQSDTEDADPIEGPQFQEASIATLKLTNKLKKSIQKKVFPREEPWLMESMLLVEKLNTSKLEANLGEGGVDNTKMEKTPETEKEKLIEILINSSKCTMERVAILENGKLAEILLKPVNSDITVGNVYLGIVKKLLPGMTGVFVDIGHTRVALLSITKNVYPFTFPPITGNSVGDTNDDGQDFATEELGLIVTPGQTDGKYDSGVREVIDYGNETDKESEEVERVLEMEDNAEAGCHPTASHEVQVIGKRRVRKVLLMTERSTRPITVNFGQRYAKWRKVEEGMRIIVQVKKEPLGKKGPKVCAFPQLASRFWVLGLGGKSIGVSKKITGSERKRLKDVAISFQKPGFDLTARTEAAGQSQEDLKKDLARLLETWKDIMDQAEAALIAAQNGQDGSVPTLLHRAMGQTLSIVRDFFAEKVQRMVVDSAQTYHEVICYLQDVAPQLQDRVELYTGTTPIFDVFNLEAKIDKILNERVQLPNGAYLVIEETEALVSIDVNGGAGMLGESMKSTAILDANLAAARQIAAELRLRDIGGIIVVDFIDMDEEEHESLVYEAMRRALQSDRSNVSFSEISENGLMELTRTRVRPSVSFMISNPCSCCHGTGRVESLETTFSKIERAILRLVANDSESIHFEGRTWKTVVLRVDPVMFEFLTRKQRTAQLMSSLKVSIALKVGRDMNRGSFELAKVKNENEKLSARSAQQQRLSRKGAQSTSGEKKGATSRA